MSYYFPDLSTTDRSSGLGYELGRCFSVRSDDPACAAEDACVWLRFDPATQRYYPPAVDIGRPGGGRLKGRRLVGLVIAENLDERQCHDL